jgi:diguanylate cyclase (GGDEF)-like protein
MIRPASRSAGIPVGAVLLGVGIGWLAAQAQMRRLRRELVAVRHEASHDPLTGLLNRRGLEHATDRLRAPSVLALFDLDGLKNINDTCGHAIGDTVLCTVADRLAHHVGRFGPVARLGGDEFVAVFTGQDADKATETARDTHALLAAPIPVGPRSILVSASIGLAETTRAATAQALRAADLAMYRAKTTGSGVEVYCPEVDGPAIISPRPDRRVRDSRSGRPQLTALPA